MLSTWALLMVAVVTEIAWGCSLKALSYFSLSRFFALIPIALTCANMYLLARVMRTLPSGLTYAIWTTLGAVGVLCQATKELTLKTTVSDPLVGSVFIQ